MTSEFALMLNSYVDMILLKVNLLCYQKEKTNCKLTSSQYENLDFPVIRKLSRFTHILKINQNILYNIIMNYDLFE